MGRQSSDCSNLPDQIAACRRRSSQEAAEFTEHMGDQASSDSHAGQAISPIFNDAAMHVTDGSGQPVPRAMTKLGTAVGMRGGPSRSTAQKTALGISVKAEVCHTDRS